jgi:RNA polymerase sigma-70 factor (ECF subfamily)
MFSCCQPSLAPEVQLSLVLNILCGFGAGEIAAALLVGRAAVEKRIARGKRTLASAKRLFDLGDEQFPGRLATVQRALYLLFNEGYHGASAEAVVRHELCDEALRLTALLAEYPRAATPETHALGALFCLQAARLPARTDALGDLSALSDQDRARYEPRLVAEGLALLERSATGQVLSAYHVEAAIAAAHVSAPTLEATDFALIVSLYDRLMQIAPSPVVALNRAIAVGEQAGPERGLSELLAIAERQRLERYPFYPAALAEFEHRLGRVETAKRHFQEALAAARNEAERRFLEKRLATVSSSR